AADEWQDRRPGAAEPCDAIRRATGLRFRPDAKGIAGEVRIVCGPGAWCVDEVPDRGGRDEGAAVRPRGGAAVPDRQRYEARRFGGGGSPVGGARHGRIFRESEDYAVTQFLTRAGALASDRRERR